MWPGAIRRDQSRRNWKESAPSFLASMWSGVNRRDQIATAPLLPLADSLLCGPARFAGISSSSAACVGIEYTARFNAARRERRDQRELERFVTALP